MEGKKLVKPQNDETVENLNVYAFEAPNNYCPNNSAQGCGISNDGSGCPCANTVRGCGVKRNCIYMDAVNVNSCG